MKHQKTTPIAIIGGGIIGLAIAFELACRDQQVTLLEKGLCGGQATGAAAGMLAPYSEIEEDPDDFFTMAHESLQMFPDWQNKVKEVSGLDFEYNRSGSLHVIFHDADELSLQTRMHWQRAWGVQAEIMKGEALFEAEPHLTKQAVAALFSPAEHHVYAPDYVLALQQACIRLGVTIIQETGVVTLHEARADGVRLATEHKGEYTADQCVIAGGAWSTFFEDQVGVPLPVFPIRGQICAYTKEDEALQHIVFSSQGYMLEKANGSIVCGASEDLAGYDTSVTEKGIDRLIRWSSRVLPFLHDRQPFHRWAGLRPATQDGYPLLGRLEHLPSVILSCGHYRNGILLSPVNAKLIADVVEGLPASINMSLFQPQRFARGTSN